MPNFKSGWHLGSKDTIKPCAYVSLVYKIISFCVGDKHNDVFLQSTRHRQLFYIDYNHNTYSHCVLVYVSSVYNIHCNIAHKTHGFLMFVIKLLLFSKTPVTLLTNIRSLPIVSKGTFKKNCLNQGGSLPQSEPIYFFSC